VNDGIGSMLLKKADTALDDVHEFVQMSTSAGVLQGGIHSAGAAFIRRTSEKLDTSIRGSCPLSSGIQTFEAGHSRRRRIAMAGHRLPSREGFQGGVYLTSISHVSDWCVYSCRPQRPFVLSVLKCTRTYS